MKRILFFNILFLFLYLSAVRAADGFFPGATKWADTNGNHINAHGGGVVFHEGAYYWFGENRDGKNSAGISCYKSTDLYNWQRLGLALTPAGSMREDMNDIAPGRTLERPKVIYNAATGKWVMWIHWENGEHYGEARSCVAISDKVEGPYQFLRTFRPNDHPTRDQTLFLDTDGKAYHIGNIDFSNMNITLLSQDFLEPTTTQNLTFAGLKFEAPALFKVGDTYYGLYSFSDGWNPTPGATGYTTDILDEWIQGDNFAVDMNKETSYKSQSTFVLKVQGYEKAFIYMGDRWNEGDINSPYVWLPLSVRTGYPVVKWYDNWDLSIFKDVDRYKRAKEIISGNNYLLLNKDADRFISQNAKNAIHIADDDENINLKFNIIETNKPYIYKIQEVGSQKYFESIFGSLRLNVESDAKSQEWIFLLQEDGYYKIKNTNDEKYLSISGASTFAGSGIYLSDKSRAKDFGIYFDSNDFDYEEADMYSASYKEVIKQQIAQQNDIIASVNSAFREPYPIVFQAYPSLNNGNFFIKTTQPIATGPNPITIRLYDGVSGILVHEQKEDNYINTSVSVNLQGKLSSGFYLVKINTDDIMSVKKIIVQ